MSAATWAQRAKAGDYLAEYEDDDLDEMSDPGSRCGYDDQELDEARAILRKRGLELEADDRGLRAVHPEGYDAEDDAACVAEMRAEHDADVRRMVGDDE